MRALVLIRSSQPENGHLRKKISSLSSHRKEDNLVLNNNLQMCKEKYKGLLVDLTLKLDVVDVVFLMEIRSEILSENLML